MANQSYEGKIKNSGTQKVEALFKTSVPNKGKVTTGNDLRTKK